MDRVRGPFLLLRPRLLPRNGGETRLPDREAGCCPGTAVRPADPIAKRVVQQVLPVCTTIWLCVMVTTGSRGGHLGRHPGLPLRHRLNGSLAGNVEGPLWDAGG